MEVVVVLVRVVEAPSFIGLRVWASTSVSIRLVHADVTRPREPGLAQPQYNASAINDRPFPMRLTECSSPSRGRRILVAPLESHETAELRFD